MAREKNNFDHQNENFDGGLNSATNPRNIANNEATIIRNIVPDSGGGMGIRKGIEAFASGLTGDDGIHSSFSWFKKDGTEHAHIAYATFLDWYDSVNDQWWHLKTGLTTGEKIGFIESNTTTADRLFFCNGVDNFSEWNGATTNLTGALTGGEVTINVTSTADFSASGTIIYNGTEIAYSGKAATTFTVASAHASSGAADGVAEAVDDSTHSADPIGRIMTIFRDRLFIVETDTNLIDYSAAGTHNDFSTAGVGGTGTINIVEGKGNITGLDIKDNRLVALKTNAIVAAIITQDSLTSEFVDIKPVIVAEDAGMENFQAMVGADNANLFFVSGNGGLKELDSVPENNLFRPLLLSHKIQPTIQDFDFTDAKTIYFRSQLLVACKETSSSSFNDVILYLNIENGKRFLSIFKGWTVGGWFVYNNKLRYGDSATNATFTAFEGFDDNNIPIEAFWTTRRHNFGQSFKKKHLFYYAIFGKMSENTNLTATVSWDNGNITRDYVIKGDGTSKDFGNYILNSMGSSVGQFQHGEQLWGGEVDEELSEFLVYLPLPKEVSGYDIKATYRSANEGDRWRILAEAASIKLRDQVAKRRKINN